MAAESQSAAQKTDAMLERISLLTKNQEQNAQKIIASVDSIATIAEETAASTEESAAAAEEQAAAMETISHTAQTLFSEAQKLTAEFQALKLHSNVSMNFETISDTNSIRKPPLNSNTIQTEMKLSSKPKSSQKS